MDGDLTLGPADRPLPFSQARRDLASAETRLAHVAELPEICTIDCGTMNFGEGDYIMTNTPVRAYGDRWPRPTQPTRRSRHDGRRACRGK